jgi:Secretion system C-terminal sorting domain
MKIVQPIYYIMKNFSTFILFFICTQFVLAQHRHDNNWVFAFKANGSNRLHFSNDTINVEPLPPNPYGSTYEAHVSMSDNDGNLIFYTNNCTVFNKNHVAMENGNGLNPGQLQTYWCNVNPFANPEDNSVIALPMPGNDQLYQIIHWDFEAFNIGQPTQFGPLRLYHTVVDMSYNGGLGKVVSKNNLVISDTLNSCALQAVRHANGRDWWILAPEFNGNCYYTILLDPLGLQIVDKQCVGSNWGKYGGGSAHFTSNGTRYVRCDTEYGLNIFDFDRCTGKLSNPAHVPIGPQGIFSINCMTLSPSGRYLYYHTLREIYQYDIEAQDIAGSKTLVATFDGFQSSGNSTDFYKSELAPDGKIYINTYGPTYHLHVIEYPDSAGLACSVKQHAITLPIRHFAAMPAYPNYRLGKLVGSPCDTITLATDEYDRATNGLSVQPNPSAGRILISFTSEEPITRIEIFDLTGKLVYSTVTNQTFIDLDINELHLGKGVFMLHALDKNGKSFVNKLVILP